MSRRSTGNVAEGARPGRGVFVFEALGRSIVRHPWRYVAVWVAIFVITVPFLPLLGTVTTNSTTTLPANAPSSLAQAEFDRLFPGQSAGGSSSYLLLTGPNLTSANAQATVINVTRGVAADRGLRAIASVSSVYSSYAAYLAGEIQLGATGLQAALAATPSLPVAVNGTSALLWGVPASFVGTWSALVANGTPPPQANVLSDRATAHEFANSSAALLVLSAFYDGAPRTGTGFNGTFDCGAQPRAV